MQDSDKLRLPCPPSNYSIKTANNNTTFVVEGLGEVNFIGKPKLTEIGSIESFFPKQNYDFAQYTGYPNPQDCANLIEKWRLNGKPIRYIITDTLVNILCSIENFECKEQDGTGDIYFTLELKEYKVINAQTQQVSQTANSLNFNDVNRIVTATRTVDKQVPNTYIVKSGENLYTIAQKLTGDSTNWSLIFAKNSSIKDPMNLTPGTVVNL
jgi:nucleoid-associated protein YgaU